MTNRKVKKSDNLHENIKTEVEKYSEYFEDVGEIDYLKFCARLTALRNYPDLLESEIEDHNICVKSLRELHTLKTKEMHKKIISWRDYISVPLATRDRELLIRELSEQGKSIQYIALHTALSVRQVKRDREYLNIYTRKRPES